MKLTQGGTVLQLGRDTLQKTMNSKQQLLVSLSRFPSLKTMSCLVTSLSSTELQDLIDRIKSVAPAPKRPAPKAAAEPAAKRGSLFWGCLTFLFSLFVFPFWSIFSHGPKMVTLLVGNKLVKKPGTFGAFLLFAASGCDVELQLQGGGERVGECTNSASL